EKDPAWSARVAPSEERAGCFGLELGVDLDGTCVALLPVVLDLLERLEQDGGLDALASSCRTTWALKLTETHHLTVPIDRLRALLRVVAEVYQGEQRPCRAFPEVRAGARVELDELFRGAGAPIAWTDPTGATHRARARVGAPRAVEVPSGLCATLRPYQNEGVAFLQRLRESGVGGV